MNSKDKLYLFHILESAEVVNEIIISDSSLDDKVNMLAMERLLQTIAESCYKLSEEFKLENDKIKWHSIKPFRNILVHDYLGDIDRNIVLDIAKVHLPEMVDFIETKLPDWRLQKQEIINDLNKNGE